ncbi:ARA1 [Linum perenne]
MLEYYQGGVEMIQRDLLVGHWKPYLERAISLKPCYEGGINGGEVAAHILQETAIGKNYASDKLSGVRRLRDAIVLGYQLQRAPGRDILVPEWYANAASELSKSTGSATVQVSQGGPLMSSEFLSRVIQTITLSPTCRSVWLLARCTSYQDIPFVLRVPILGRPNSPISLTLRQQLSLSFSLLHTLIFH